MDHSAYKTAMQIRTKTMQFHLISFTGKEKDEETCYGYFGARYMDHELMTMWLSVDPMADKYPSISPYAYCAWNPIRLTDPSGDSIRLNGTEEQRQKVVEYLHQYSNLTFQYDDKGYLTLNTDLPGSEIKTRTDQYIEEMVNNHDNICVLEIMNTDHEKMQPGNPTLFGGTSDLQRDDKGLITRVEGVQYININKLGTFCGSGNESREYPGIVILHEFSEGFEGCKLARRFNRKLRMNNDDYSLAHAKANDHFWAEFERGTDGVINLKSRYLR